MRKFAAVGISLALLSAAVPGLARERNGDRGNFGRATANPSAIVQAELSFARLAATNGQWTAFRQTAADDAVMFTPDLVNAQQWLKNKADPAVAVDWQPQKIFMSCDGSMAVSIGAWQGPNGDVGTYTTIWRQENFQGQLSRQKKGKDPEWKWVLDDGQISTSALPEPEFIETALASCKGRSTAVAPALMADAPAASGSSEDQSLIWRVESPAPQSRQLTVYFWNGEQYDIALSRAMTASATAATAYPSAP